MKKGILTVINMLLLVTTMMQAQVVRVLNTDKGLIKDTIETTIRFPKMIYDAWVTKDFNTDKVWCFVVMAAEEADVVLYAEWKSGLTIDDFTKEVVNWRELDMANVTQRMLAWEKLEPFTFMQLGGKRYWVRCAVASSRQAGDKYETPLVYCTMRDLGRREAALCNLRPDGCVVGVLEAKGTKIGLIAPQSSEQVFKSER